MNRPLAAQQRGDLPSNVGCGWGSLTPGSTITTPKDEEDEDDDEEKDEDPWAAGRFCA